ncbi:LLM class flavin-dependent oxidoreductase [Rhodococcus koreensis]|uniref:LLM class flavin-dependent oxidoreductase n=1 Tax=Rhodococcus koreensis TaxID=99653 RepID=UPI00197FCA4A|nr:LLM class flavin-dependent oxidoreductase [Rhodococcus koreensis]QSE78270.1 LLM class flavin-dependent oxidoreductase [Rhodococcus koreensis]
MSTPILIDLAVGDARAGAEPDRFDPVSPAAAVTVTEAAREAGVAALRLLDTAGGRRAIDPSVAGAYLAGRFGDIGYLVEVPTTHNAPYNVARRVLSFDRATAGRVGVVLRPGAGDEVSAATVPDPVAAAPVERWSEYAQILTRLWESFPRDALIGDQERALVVDDALIRAIDHEGRFYRVAGPLDGPSSLEGRPVVVAADLDVLGWAAVARSADAVVVDRGQSAGADLALTAGLEQAGRKREDVALIGRVGVTLSAGASARTLADELAAWIDRDKLDAVELVPTGGVDGVLAAVRTLVPLLSASTGPTLRASLGLRDTVEALS